MEIIRINIRFLLCCFVVTIFFAVGCAAMEDDNWDDDFGESRRNKSILEMMGAEETLAFAHMMRNIQIEEPEMEPADRKYLSKRCDVKDCHDLNRVFWLNGPRSTWEKVLNLMYHQGVKLKPEEKERLYGIFEQYLSQPYNNPKLRK